MESELLIINNVFLLQEGLMYFCVQLFAGICTDLLYVVYVFADLKV